MLLEAAVYAASLPGTPRSAVPHLSEAIGLWSRGRRQARAWAPHLENTRAAIEAAAQTISSRRTAVVLGSGPLFDVPLDTLANAFARVLLIDRVHALPARLQARRHPNVELIWRDLSEPADADPLAFLNQFGGLDWVVSVNLVSQLGIGAPEGEERTAIDTHLDSLFARPCKVTLITDLGYDLRDRAGKVIEQFDLLHGRPMPAPAARWTWMVAPFGEGQLGAERIHTVAAYPDWKAAAGV